MPSRPVTARAVWTARQARPDQVWPDGDWATWLILAGRGWGKTRTGAEELMWQAWRQPGTRWAVIAPTWADTKMVAFQGESGLLAVAHRYGVVRDWNKSLGQITLTNGSLLIGYSADKPDRLRGPQHHGAWCDELAAWRYPEAWDHLRLGLRLGQSPRTIVTTTPRPTPLIRRERDRPTTLLTTGSTFDNAANLAPTALAEFRERYEGTRLGRQELYAEVLDEAEGALWSHALFDACRVTEIPERVVRTAVGVDPAVTVTETSDETGIVTASLGESGTVYITGDHSGKYPPQVWANKVAGLDADVIVAEVNQGGDLVTQTLVAAGCGQRVKQARASKGKQARAEPVSVLYERGRVKHVGTFPALEDQAASWVPGEGPSPDRVDALVWAVSHLVRSPRPVRLVGT
jgi:phage terminase large subunit-like protein